MIEPRRTLADALGLDRDAIYLFRADQTAPIRILSAGTTLIEWAEVAPDLQAIAYGFTYPDPKKIDVVPERRTSGVGILDAAGKEQFRIIGGRAAAWSPSGRRLAVLTPRRMRGEQDTLRIWDRRSDDFVMYRVAPSEGLVWRTDDTLVIGTNTLVASTGKVASSGHAGNLISPDRRYSMINGAQGPGIWLDVAKVDIAQSVVQVCGATRLRQVGRAAWISGHGEGHITALAVVEDTTAHHATSREPNLTSIIDVSIPELLDTIPGRLVGLASDGRTLVLLRKDGVHFVSARTGRRASRSAMAYGSGVGPHPARVWIEMTTIQWWHKVVLDGTDTLEVRTLSVAPGDRIVDEASHFFRDGLPTFRVVAIRSNGSALVESRPGLVPAGQQFMNDFGHRFIVTSGPVDVGTASYDGGEVFRLRLVPESLARERIRNGTARRKGQSQTTLMGRPYVPKPDTTFDQPPRLLTQALAWLPKPWGRNQGERLIYVTALIDTNGQASNPKLALTSSSDIEAAVLDAARHAVFEPARKRGRPIPTGWGFNVELKHPRSPELAAPEDTSSTSLVAGRDVAVHVRASAYYDSVDEKYCYSYALENRSKDPTRVTSLTLLGCATDVADEAENPENWNGYFCGSNPGVQGWIIWERDPKEGWFGYATKPGAWLAPLKFKSKAPPGRVRWIAQTATDKSFTQAMPCSRSDFELSTGTSLSGTIVGPVNSRSAP